MKRLYCTVAAATLGLGAAPSALAASDYLLVIDGVEGEAASSAEILSWSWGASNPSSAAAATDRAVSPRDAASGNRSHKSGHTGLTASQNSQSLRGSPANDSTADTRRKNAAPKGGWDLATGKGARTSSSKDGDCDDACAATPTHIVTGDVDGDGQPDLAAVASRDEITGFSITFDKASPVLARHCAQGQHIKDAKITRLSEIVYELQDVVVTGCAATGEAAKGSGGGAGKASMSDLSVMNGVTLTLTGSMKHTKTGHVTLLK